MPIIQNGQGLEIAVPPGQSIAVASLTGTYSATLLDGAGRGVLASASAGGATYGPYPAGATLRVKAGVDSCVAYDVGVQPVAAANPVARYSTDAYGNVSGLVGPDGNSWGGMTGEKLGIVMVSDSTGADGYEEANPNGGQWFDSVAWWAAAYSSGAVGVQSRCSIGGWTTANVDANWRAQVANKRVKFVVLGIGLNDIYAATDGTVTAETGRLQSWFEEKVREVMAWGGVPIVQTTFPCGSSYFASTATKRIAAFNHNKWRRALSAKLGLPLLDAESLIIDPSSATAEPYAVLMQANGSPHAGKEIIRTLGKMLWDQTLSKMVPSVGIEQSNKYAENQLFSNPGFSGTDGNVNGGDVASVLPSSVWGWQTASHTTYSVQASTDSKLQYAGAPVKSPWVRVSTDVSAIPVAAPGSTQSSAMPGLLFFSSGLSFTAGEVVHAQAEIELVTPNSIIGFDCLLQISGGSDSVNHVGASSFTPGSNADNAKNEIKAPTVFCLPATALTITEDIAGGGAWLTINPKFSGVTGAAGAAVWRVRNVKVWKD